jgi:hypothetical protein
VLRVSAVPAIGPAACRFLPRNAEAATAQFAPIAGDAACAAMAQIELEIDAHAGATRLAGAARERASAAIGQVAGSVNARAVAVIEADLPNVSLVLAHDAMATVLFVVALLVDLLAGGRLIRVPTYQPHRHAGRERLSWQARREQSGESFEQAFDHRRDSMSRRVNCWTGDVGGDWSSSASMGRVREPYLDPTPGSGFNRSSRRVRSVAPGGGVISSGAIIDQ